MKEERDNTSRVGGLPTLPGLYLSTFQPSQRGFFRVLHRFNAHHFRFHIWFLLNPGTDFPHLTSLQKCSLFAGNFKQSLGAKNRVGIGLLYRPARAWMFKLSRSPGTDSEESIPAAICSLAGQYDKLYYYSFLDPTDCLKIPGKTIHACWTDYFHSILRSLKV